MPQLPGRIFVAGHRGLVGSAVHRALVDRGVQPVVRTRDELDLLDGAAVRSFFAKEKPNAVVLAAAKVGGIQANNTYRWDFIFENLAIETNIIGSAFAAGVERLVFLGSSCIYPKMAPQPMREDALLTGPLESTNEPYAIAKIAGIKLVDAANEQHGRRWISLMPTNLYGPGDNFDLETSHVLPALIRKFHDAKVSLEAGRSSAVRLWGTGSALREFLYVDDMAQAVVHVLSTKDTGMLNVGYGEEISIRELAALVAEIVGYDGRVEWDASRPDGTPRKLLDSSRIRATGWRPRVELRDGIRRTYDWFLTNSAPLTDVVGAA